MSIHDGHRERTKAEFLARPESFPDHRMLEVLLYYANPRGDTNPTAHALLERYGTVAGVLDAEADELQNVPGVGAHTACLLKISKEVCRRYVATRGGVGEQICSLRDAQEILQPYFFGARNERVCLICMDAKSRVLGIRIIGEGTVNAAEVMTRKIVEAALFLNATHVILAHNHTDGVAAPSEEDKMTTGYLIEVLSHVNVILVDHVICTDDEIVSMRESGSSLFRPRGKDRITP